MVAYRKIPVLNPAPILFIIFCKRVKHIYHYQIIAGWDGNALSAYPHFFVRFFPKESIFQIMDIALLFLFLFAGVFFMQNGFSMHGTPIPTSLFKFRGLWLEKNYSFISENSYVNCMLLIHSSPPSSAKSDLKWAPLLSFLVSADLAMAFPARSMFLSSSFLTRPL